MAPLFVNCFNQKIKKGEDSIWVMDRGMDRNIIYDDLNAKGCQYIIRQKGNRKLNYNGQAQGFIQISRNVKLAYEYKSKRIYKSKKRTLHFSGGAVKVSLANNKKALWLVVLKIQKRGYSWYLMNNPACQTEQQAVESILEGYGLRWKIEEVHRQKKTDYHLEAIRLQRYEALKNLNALLWMVVSFLYTRLESLALEIINEPELGLINRRKLVDILRYVYYKLALALKKILALAKVYYPPRAGTQNKWQLELAFPEYI